MQFIDLSIPITNDVVSDPPVMRPQIHYTTHETSWEQIALFFPGLEKQDLPDGEGWAVETLTLSTHNGTHMDAPWHYHSTTDSGARRAPSIDEAPLDRFFRPGVKLDFSHLPHGAVISAADIDVLYGMPLELHRQGLDELLAEVLSRVPEEGATAELVAVDLRAGEQKSEAHLARQPFLRGRVGLAFEDGTHLVGTDVLDHGQRVGRRHHGAGRLGRQRARPARAGVPPQVY